MKTTLYQTTKDWYVSGKFVYTTTHYSLETEYQYVPGLINSPSQSDSDFGGPFVYGVDVLMKDKTIGELRDIILQFRQNLNIDCDNQWIWQDNWLIIYRDAYYAEDGVDVFNGDADPKENQIYFRWYDMDANGNLYYS